MIRVLVSLALSSILIGLAVAGQTAPSGGSFVNGRVQDGEELAVDFPTDQFISNIGSKIDGAGMCVDTSIEMAARWAGMEEWRGFRDYWAAKEGGGNYPSGVDRQIKAYASLKNIPVPAYVQYQGDSPEEILTLAHKTGRLACIAYGYSPRYGGPINHMVCVPKFAGSYGVVMDNNLIGGVTRQSLFEWMPTAELLRRMKICDGGGRTVPCKAWVFLWLTPSPPPIPHN